MIRMDDHRHRRAEFVRELSAVINRYSREHPSNTPDFILAEYLAEVLEAYDGAILARSHWYGRLDHPGGLARGATQIPRADDADTTHTGEC